MVQPLRSLILKSTTVKFEKNSCQKAIKQKWRRETQMRCFLIHESSVNSCMFTSSTWQALNSLHFENEDEYDEADGVNDDKDDFSENQSESSRISEKASKVRVELFRLTCIWKSSEQRFCFLLFLIKVPTTKVIAPG